MKILINFAPTNFALILYLANELILKTDSLIFGEVISFKFQIGLTEKGLNSKCSFTLYCCFEAGYSADNKRDL